MYRGVIVGVAIKTMTTVILIGLDDFLLVRKLLRGVRLSSGGGVWGSAFDIYHSAGASDQLVGVDEGGGRFIDRVRNILGAPLMWIEEHCGVASAAERLQALEVDDSLEASTGWNAPANVLAEDVLVLGTANLASKGIGEQVLVKGVDALETTGQEATRHRSRWHRRFRRTQEESEC